jgi:predicted O-methyltransferase YrrM
VVLEDHEVLRRTLNSLSNTIAAESTADRALPDDLTRIDGFEDCVWLLSSNVVNHGTARLMLSEAARLYGTVRSLDHPRVVELGRYRGGTTVLMAAAGAHVLSLDVDAGLAESDRRLRDVLERLGLAERVELVVADSGTYPAEPGSVDLVFVDGDHRYEGVVRDVENWLPAIRPGGFLALHDAQSVEPARPWNSPPDGQVRGVHRFAAELRQRHDLREEPGAGTLVLFRTARD